MLPWNGEDLTFDETRFRGTARLFPLPDLVMFPHVVQPLHIFEQRYREMLREALDSDGLIAMSVIEPQTSPPMIRVDELSEDQRPELAPFACLGKVVTHQRLADGRYNLMLLGVRRVRIIEELPQRRTFREARVELLEDYESNLSDLRREMLQAKLTEAFRLALPEGSMPSEAITELLSDEIPLGVLTDLVSFALPIPDKLKRAMLSESNVDLRARQLLRALNAAEPHFSLHEPEPAAAAEFSHGFPPPFSSN